MRKFKGERPRARAAVKIQRGGADKKLSMSEHKPDRNLSPQSLADYYEDLLVSEGLAPIESVGAFRACIQPQVFYEHNSDSRSPAYYSHVERMLSVHKFKSPRNRMIFKLHVAGFSYRRIESRLRSMHFKAVSYVQIKRIIEGEIRAFAAAALSPEVFEKIVK